MTTTHFIHPGIILREEFFEPLGITQLAAAKALGIPQSRLSDILAGHRGITAETAVRLGKFFNVDPGNFINLQAHYDLALAKAEFAHSRPRPKIVSYTRVARTPDPIPA
ncbi:MAG: HigA family addiction module antidote protein [Opitutaceae bacterium]|jgi:addiction module HigA family antidote|nr:HigA family addiction module antidote protein [Opitutaceae bacterium]